MRGASTFNEFFRRNMRLWRAWEKAYEAQNWDRCVAIATAGEKLSEIWEVEHNGKHYTAGI